MDVKSVVAGAPRVVVLLQTTTSQSIERLNLLGVQLEVTQ
jgi:hypothetical protein